MNEITDPSDLIARRRKITGMSAILLPFNSDHTICWTEFESHVQRTCEAGLVPAVNMDTGYANLIDESTRLEVLQRTKATIPGMSYLAGAFVSDTPKSSFDLDAYESQCASIVSQGGTPILFQSYGLAHQPDEQIVENYRRIAKNLDQFYAFELGTMFAPFGKIYSLDVYRELMNIAECLGAKHSSLERQLEWERLHLRNELRPDFKVLTGNDLAIDMVKYGSDYLLGLSTFCPDLFAKRDAYWETGDPAFYQLNDVLQYLGFFAFRNPTSAYKHSAAMFLNQRGWIGHDLSHPHSPKRPESDRAILFEIGKQLGLELTP